MKYLLLLFSFFCFTNVFYGQIVDCFEEEVEAQEDGNLALGKNARQSSTYAFDGGFASLAVDGDRGAPHSEQYAMTNAESRSWWEVDLEQAYHIKNVKLFYPEERYSGGMNEFYVLLSEIPFGDADLSTLIASPAVRHLYVDHPVSSGVSIPASDINARYVRIQFAGVGTSAFYEVEITGPGDPTTSEICDNGIDDDQDCKIDCEDYDCAPLIWNVNYVHPTCKICDDGSITITSYSKSFPLEYSIDGGTTFQNAGNATQHTFHHLLEGDYKIVVRNPNCKTEWPHVVQLRAPLGNPSAGGCDNGGFESGDGTNWSRTIGHNDDGNYVIDVSGVNLNNVILSGQILDAQVNKTITPAEGTYFGRINIHSTSNSTAGNSFRYCMTVDQSNAKTSFYYYLVLEDGSDAHSLGENPFFEIRVLDNNGNVLQQIDRVVADVTNPYFVVNGSFAYKEWTCRELDLSAFINQNICLEFIAVRCAQGGHSGYAYIDALCSDIKPVVDIVTPPVYCANQPVDVLFENDKLFNEYQVTICRVKPDGSTFDPLTLPREIGYEVPDLMDMISIYKQQYPNYVVDCVHKFRVKVTLFNDCTINEVSKDIVFSCNAFDLSYPDLLLCNPQQDIQLTGTNTCTGCSVQWSVEHDPNNLNTDISAYMFGANTSNPTIHGTTNWNAFNLVYRVTVNTSEGCVYTDLVNTINIHNFQGSIGTAATHLCSFDSISTINFPYDIVFKKYFTLDYFLKGDYEQVPNDTPYANIPEESIPFFSVPGLDVPGSNRVITPKLNRLLRGMKQQIRLLIRIKPEAFNDPDIRIIDVCDKEFKIVRDADSPYFGDIDLYAPTAFCEEGTALEPENEEWTVFFSDNVYEAWLTVFDRWGEKVFEGHSKAMNNMPMDPDPLFWDGKFKGKKAERDVYTFMVDYQNCQVAPSDCFDDQTVIAPNLNTTSPTVIPFKGLSRGVNVNAQIDAMFNVFNCGASPISNINSAGSCILFECNDKAHAGSVTLMNCGY